MMDLKSVNHLKDLKIDGYTCYSTTTEADKGGALLYIKEHCNVKPLPTLEKMMFKPKQLESVFIELCNENENIV